MAATITHRVATPDSGNTPNASGAFSFASGDLLVVFVTKEASVPSTYASGDLTVASVTGVSTFTLITAVGIDGADVDGLGVWVANQKATGAGAAGVVTIGSGSDAGAGSNIAVFTVAGLHASALGAAAVKQSGSLANQSTGVIPSINLGTGAADTNNAIVGGIGVVDGTPALTPPTNFTEGADTGYTTGKAQGIETVFRNSGHTAQAVAWVTAATGGAWGGIVLELNTVLVRTDRRLGTVTPSGTRTESKSHTSKPTGTITLTGTRSESHTIAGPSNTDRVSGTIRLARGIHAEIQSLTPSLYWPLDARYGANDQSLAGTNDGTGGGGISIGAYSSSPIIGETTSTDFASGYIDAPYTPFVNGTVRTFIGWAYRDDTSDYHTLFAGDATNGCWLRCDSGTDDVLFRVNSQDSGATSQCSWTGVFPSGVWKFWVLIFDESADTAELYIDGKSQGVKTGLSLPWAADGGTYRLGRYAGSGFYWNGRMVHVGIFEYGLTSSQISLLWQSRTGASSDSESLTHTSKPTGVITLSGTKAESYSITDVRSGVVTVTGTRRESKSETFKTTGTVVLQGTRTESHALSFTDRRSGMVSLAGTRQESFTHVSKPTGTIQLSGTVSERNLGPTIDRPTGTIALTGTRRESFSGTEKPTGIVLLSGQIDETFAGSITDSVSGTILLTGTRQESNSRTVQVSGQITLTGTVSESHVVSGGTETHSVSGTITLSGTRRESKTYTDKTTGQILVSGTLSESLSTSFTDTPSGVIVLSGTRLESNNRTVLCDGIIILSGQVHEVYLPAGLTIDRRSGTIRLTGRMRELHSRWDNLGGERWPADTDSRWPGDNGERWNHDSDSRWGQDAPERWETDLVP